MPVSDECIRGRIFDIQRFCTHDGTGIRTGVFLMGCPLRCVWCQNPEGISAVRQPVWVETACIRCGSCTVASSAGGVEMHGQRITVYPDRPEDFDHLIYVCPANALRWNCEDMTVEDVMGHVRRDKPFYRHGGGGLTLSGGDPLAQPEFAAAMLRACSEEQIHTAVETEMYAPWAVIEHILPHTDLLFADFKLINMDEAERYTGVRPQRILENLERVLQGQWRDKVVVRTPLVPGVTATKRNIAAIARFLARLWPDVPYELLNYNPLAAAKYRLAGLPFTLDGIGPLPKSEVAVLEDIARRSGLQRVRQEGAADKRGG